MTRPTLSAALPRAADGISTRAPKTPFSKDFWLLIAFALALRLFAVFHLPGYSSETGLDHYEAVAKAFLEGKGFMHLEGKLSAYRAPLYPLFLAGVYRMFGPLPAMAWIAQCVLGALTAGCIYLLATRYVPRRYALAAGVTAAVYPPFLRTCGFLLSETLFLCLFMAALCCLRPRWWETSLGRAAAAGALFGLASLTRPVVFLLPLGLIVLAAGVGLVSKTRVRWTALGVLAVAFFLILAPWGIRNWMLLGKPVLTTTESGASLWIGVHPDPMGFGYNNFDNLVGLLDKAGMTGELEMDKYLFEEGLRDIGADPVRYAKLAVAKIAWLYYVFDGNDYGMGTCYNLPAALIIALGLAGMAWAGLRKENLMLSVIVLYFTGIAAVLYGIPRFRMPVDPLLMIFGVIALHATGTTKPAVRTRWMALIAAWVLVNAGMALGGDGAKLAIRDFLDRNVGYSHLVRGTS